MPQVGGKHFAYTPAGEKAASAYAKKTGMPLMKNYKDGGPVKNYKKGGTVRGGGAATRGLGFNNNPTKA